MDVLGEIGREAGEEIEGWGNLWEQRRDSGNRIHRGCLGVAWL